MIGDEMAAESGTRMVCLGSHDFEIIFQIIHQATNFSELRLAVVGCTSEELDLLIATLRPAREDAERLSEVCIEFYDEAGPAGARPGRGADTDYVSDSAVRVRLPLRFVEQWGALAKLVVSSLRPRELFLRTGYEFDVIRAAVAHLQGTGGVNG
jgi:hypothetical protein